MITDVFLIEQFLISVDNSFPIPLSEKQDLHDYSIKLFNKATLCVEKDAGKIVAMVAGYTENVIDNMAYISIVATNAEYRGKGLASKLINEFIAVCKNKKLRAVHLYTDPKNSVAIKMYIGLGFEHYITKDEMRPDDVHLIYRIDREKN